MKKAIHTFTLALLLAFPLSISADTLVPLGPTVEQLLAREAFLKAQNGGTSVACIVRTNVATTKVRQPFQLWWGSYGGNGVGWAPSGSYTIVVDKAGTYRYELTFYTQSGSSATCQTSVSVS